MLLETTGPKLIHLIIYDNVLGYDLKDFEKHVRDVLRSESNVIVLILF